MADDEGSEIEARLAAQPREVHRRAAALLREVRPRLAAPRQREIAEEMAGRFDRRAAAASGSR
jgi:hypothetical protein